MFSVLGGCCLGCVAVVLCGTAPQLFPPGFFFGVSLLLSLHTPLSSPGAPLCCPSDPARLLSLPSSAFSPSTSCSSPPSLLPPCVHLQRLWACSCAASTAPTWRRWPRNCRAGCCPVVCCLFHVLLSAILPANWAAKPKHGLSRGSVLWPLLAGVVWGKCGRTMSEVDGDRHRPA